MHKLIFAALLSFAVYPDWPNSLLTKGQQWVRWTSEVQAMTNPAQP